MCRHEPNGPTSAIHIFSTQFMTTLRDAGVSGVASWTAKKSINVFEKCFLIIPVHESLHWSLCVVVNPGKIAVNHMGQKYMQEDEEDTL